MHQPLAVRRHHVVSLFRAKHFLVEFKRGHTVVDDQVRNELVFAVHRFPPGLELIENQDDTTATERFWSAAA